MPMPMFSDEELALVVVSKLVWYIKLSPAGRLLDCGGGVGVEVGIGVGVEVGFGVEVGVVVGVGGVGVAGCVGVGVTTGGKVPVDGA